jgi:AmmeMemoRadiSam system protein B
MKRKAVVAGSFYEADETTLKQRIRNCFEEERGPKKLPRIEQKEPLVKGVVVPHAGFLYSGAIAAHSYHFLAKHGFGDVFIILGPNHSGMGSGVSMMTSGSWMTPLGEVPIDETLAGQLFQGIIDQDETAHLQEHSIEVQLPFLQFCAGSKPFSFVPICMAMQDSQTAEEIGTIIADVAQKSEKRIVVIASSDFSHVGFNYMTMPPSGMKVDEFAHQQDTYALKMIQALDPQGLIKTVQTYHISMCGSGPVAAMLTAAKLSGAREVELLKYGTSYEVHPGSSCVGYGALAVY